MEASQAGLAGGDAAAQGAQGAAGGEQQSQGIDGAALAEQLSQMAAGQEQLRDYLQSEPWRPAEEAQPEAEPELDLSFLDPDSVGFDPNEVADKLGGLIAQTQEQARDQVVRQEIDPLRQELQELRQEREMERLAEEFPDLAEPGAGEQLFQVAGQVAQAYGQPELGTQPWFARLVFMAGRAADSANAEGAETPAAAHLESGAGARPGAVSSAGLDEQFNAAVRGGNSVLPFG